MFLSIYSPNPPHLRGREQCGLVAAGDPSVASDRAACEGAPGGVAWHGGRWFDHGSPLVASSGETEEIKQRK